MRAGEQANSRRDQEGLDAGGVFHAPAPEHCLESIVHISPRNVMPLLLGAHVMHYLRLSMITRLPNPLTLNIK